MFFCEFFLFFSSFQWFLGDVEGMGLVEDEEGECSKWVDKGVLSWYELRTDEGPRECDAKCDFFEG